VGAVEVVGRVVVGKVRLELFRFNYLASMVEGGFQMQGSL
jgi:hypothetical protein